MSEWLRIHVVVSAQKLSKRYLLSSLMTNISHLLIHMLQNCFNLCDHVIVNILKFKRSIDKLFNFYQWNNIKLNIFVFSQEILQSISLVKILEQQFLINKHFWVKLWWIISLSKIFSELIVVNVLALVLEHWLDHVSCLLWSIVCESEALQSFLGLFRDSLLKGGDAVDFVSH